MTTTDVLHKIDLVLEGLVCWCTWDESWLPLTHEEFCAANEYPPHGISAEWNLPEPSEGFECWDGTSPDAASTEADDLDQVGTYLALARPWDMDGILVEVEDDTDDAVLLALVQHGQAGERDVVELARGKAHELMR